MTGRAGARIAAALSTVTWLSAVALTALFVDMPLHPEGPAAAPAIEQLPPSPPAERKAKEKVIEISPWEEVPA